MGGHHQSGNSRRFGFGRSAWHEYDESVKVNKWLIRHPWHSE